VIPAIRNTLYPDLKLLASEPQPLVSRIASAPTACSLSASQLAYASAPTLPPLLSAYLLIFIYNLRPAFYGSEIALLRASRQTPIDAVKQLMLANGFANKGN